MREVPIAELVLEGTQTRAQMNEQVVAEYADLYRDGGQLALPPVEVVEVGGRLRLVDGFHRVNAAKAAGLERVMAEVEQGSEQLCLERALSANSRHGLRRTKADKRRAVEIALSHEHYRTMSFRKVADLCGVHHDLVAKVFYEMYPPDDEPETAVEEEPLAADAEDEVDFSPPQQKKPRAPVSLEPEGPAEMQDKLGRPIPDTAELAPVRDDFANQSAFTPIRRALREVREAIERVRRENPARRLAYCDLEEIDMRVGSLLTAIERARVDPFVMSDKLPAQPWSEFQAKEEPRIDRHTGWVPKQVFDTQYPDHIRKAMVRASGGGG